MQKIITFIKKIRNIKELFKFICKSGLNRVLWILKYSEIILGGDVSIKSKLPFTQNKNPLPWYTYPAIEYLDQFDLSKSIIFEYGSGNSSKFWSTRSQSVISIESNLSWYEKGNRELSANQTLLLRIEKDEYVNAINENENQFDVIIIDGIYRYNCTINAIMKLKEGGLIILDNSDWYPNTTSFLRDTGFTQIDFIGCGPINSYAWCTSFFIANKILIPRKTFNRSIIVLGGIEQRPLDDQAL